MKIGTYPNKMAEVFSKHFEYYECSELTSSVQLKAEVSEKIVKEFAVTEIDTLIPDSV